jgi:hypothetical protein
MEAGLQARVKIGLPEAACLVLFEVLATSYDQGREINPNDVSANLMMVDTSRPAQRGSHLSRVRAFLTKCFLLRTPAKLNNSESNTSEARDRLLEDVPHRVSRQGLLAALNRSRSILSPTQASRNIIEPRCWGAKRKLSSRL